MDLLKARKIIQVPLTTEKNVGRQDTQHQYTFRVDRGANKIEIKEAVQDIFKVKVLRVNTAHMQGKNKRVRFHAGRTSSWKKAVVTLKPGDKIELV